MNRTRWGLRGPVRSMRSEIGSDWQAERAAWGERRWFETVFFDRGGQVVQVEQRGSSGTIARQTFRADDDQHKSRTHVRHFGPETRHVDGYSIEGSETGYGAPGAVSMTTVYNDRELPVEAIFHDAQGEVVQHVRMTRDEHGRVILEEANLPRPSLPGMASWPEDELRAMQALFAAVAGTIRTTYSYNDQGSRTRRTRTFGQLSEERTEYRYNEHGFLSEETSETTDRESTLDDTGNPQLGAGITRLEQARYAYLYDVRGNWIERVMSSRIDRAAEFTPSTAEWRTIEYWD